MTIKNKILKLMADGKERNYKDIARILKCKPVTVGVNLMKLKQDGIIFTPVIISTRPKCGWYQLPTADKNQTRK